MSMTEPKKILKWEFVPAVEQEKYLERARYLIEFGYQTLNGKHVETLAKRIYYSDNEDNHGDD